MDDQDILKYLKIIESEKILNNRFTFIKRMGKAGGNGGLRRGGYGYSGYLAACPDRAALARIIHKPSAAASSSLADPEEKGEEKGDRGVVEKASIVTVIM